ncbi:unnamed protein product, partial [Scytosiphon promiscuus]
MTEFKAAEVYLEAGSRKHSVPVVMVGTENYEDFAKSLTPAQKNWLALKDFNGKAGQLQPVPDEDGK